MILLLVSGGIVCVVNAVAGVGDEVGDEVGHADRDDVINPGIVDGFAVVAMVAVAWNTGGMRGVCVVGIGSTRMAWKI